MVGNGWDGENTRGEMKRDNKNLKPFKKQSMNLKTQIYSYIYTYILCDWLYVNSCWYKILINLETRPIWYPGVWFGFKYSKKNVLDKHMFFNVNAVLDWLNG